MKMVEGDSGAPRALAGVVSENFAPRLAASMNVVVITAVLLIQLINVSQLHVTADGAPIPDGLKAACFVGTGALFGLQMVHSNRLLRPRSTWILVVTFGVQAVITYLPTFYLGEAWGGAAGFLLGSVLLLIRPAWLAFGVFAVLEVVTGYIAVINDQTWTNVLYAVVANGLTALVLYSVSKLADIVTALHDARRELAANAVEEERQRFSRDLHDLLGYSLSAVVLQGELAYVATDADPAAAKRYVTSILAIARMALQDVRSVARGSGTMGLHAQLVSARSVLRSAGIEGESEQVRTVLPEVCDSVLSIVVREAVTNVLRHSKAEVCDIRLTVDDDVAMLRISNDGLSSAAMGRARGYGRAPFDAETGGLVNLHLRMQQIDGTLAVHVDDDNRFVVTATVPIPAQSADPPC